MENANDFRDISARDDPANLVVAIEVPEPPGDDISTQTWNVDLDEGFRTQANNQLHVSLLLLGYRYHQNDVHNILSAAVLPAEFDVRLVAPAGVPFDSAADHLVLVPDNGARQHFQGVYASIVQAFTDAGLQIETSIPFWPHCTIATRVQRARGTPSPVAEQFVADNAAFTTDTFHVDRIHLYSTNRQHRTGWQYDTLQTYMLRQNKQE